MMTEDDRALMAAFVHLGGDPDREGGPQRTVATLRLAESMKAFAASEQACLLAALRKARLYLCSAIAASDPMFRAVDHPFVKEIDAALAKAEDRG